LELFNQIYSIQIAIRKIIIYIKMKITIKRNSFVIKTQISMSLSQLQVYQSQTKDIIEIITFKSKIF
jgi:hypothetical protein